MPAVKSVLFDADGVLQRPTVRWGPAFGSLFGIEKDELDGFLREVFALEGPYLAHNGDFSGALGRLLASRRWSDHLDATLAVFNAIDVVPDVLDIVRRLRRAGVGCYLGTNQQSHRAAHMSRGLGYEHLFDREFYSCRVGAAKPDTAFFEHVLRAVGLPAESVLFIDDREENVRAARSVGMVATVFDESEGAAKLLSHLRLAGLVPFDDPDP